MRVPESGPFPGASPPRSTLTPQPRSSEQPVGSLVSFPNPIDDLIRLRRILQLDAHRFVNPQGLDLLQVRGEIDDPSSGRQVAVDLAVTIADVDVDGLSLQPSQLFGSRV